MKKLFNAFFFSYVAFALLNCQNEHQDRVQYYQSEETKALSFPFSDAVQVGDLLFLSGQIGNKPGEMKLVEGGLEAEAKQVMENIKRVLEANGSSLEHAVKFTVFIDDIERWSDFNDVYVDYFDNKLPARSALGVEGLALGAQIEVECIALIPK